MAERIVAKATLANGVSFTVELANLTPRSVFVITDRRLVFREHMRLSLEGMELAGEIVYLAQENPRGAVLVLDSTKASAKLAQLMEDSEVLDAPTQDEMWSESTAPELPDEPTSEDAHIDPALMRAAFLDGSKGMEVDTDELEREAFSPEPDDTGIEMILPELEDDGTLKFASAADYKAQYNSDIVKGGLIARSLPLPLGTPRMVRVVVPGSSEPIAVSARVGFVGSGTVGLMIDSFAKHKHLFDRLFQALVK